MAFTNSPDNWEKNRERFLLLFQLLDVRKQIINNYELQRKHPNEKETLELGLNNLYIIQKEIEIELFGYYTEPIYDRGENNE